MNPRSTAVLFVVALLLGAFVYLYEIEGEEGRLEAEEAGKRVFADLEQEDIWGVELTTTDDREARLESRDGEWRVVSPVDFPADEIAADAIASTLAKLSNEGVIDEPQSPETYGLGEDAPRVRFDVGQTQRGLTLGKKTPVGSNSYVAAEGDPRVFMVPAWRLNSFQKSLDELRDRRVLRFDRATVERVAVGWPDTGVTLEKRDGDWWLVSPIEDRADPETVEDLLSELSFLRAEGFVDGEVDVVEQRLRPPELHVVLGLEPEEEGEIREVEFLLGQVRAEGDRLAQGTEPSYFTIPAERIDDFARTVVAYRFKDLAEFESADARRFELVFEDPDGTVVIEGVRSDGGWETSPEAMAPGRASSLVSELSTLKADSIAAESAGDEELRGLGLAPPSTRLRVYGEPGEEGGEETLLADVSLGAVDASQGIMARSGSSGPIYRIDLELAEHLPVSLEAFRNRFRASDEEEAPSEFDEAFSEDPTPELLEGEPAP
ncbi:MAG: DUF4340 domain-containing protein [Myxococcota bacterium]